MAPCDAKHTVTLTGGGRLSQKQSAYLFHLVRFDRPLDPGARFSLDSLDVVELERADPLRAEQFSENGARVLCIGIPDPGISARRHLAADVTALSPGSSDAPARGRERLHEGGANTRGTFARPAFSRS